MGNIPTALTAVTMNEESVSSSASHPRAIMVMKNEVMEMREAAQKIRNWGYAKARRGPRRRGGLVPFAGVWSLSEIMGILPYGAVRAAPSSSEESACDQYTPSVKRGVKD